ncbi:glycosyltransferase family 2 protein [Ilumatobacter sp.]|uniref:glycosyltransferase family 2 protein n=1 Tax=Ilumatobacter sp. TaxID=1967498 RepID=UPI003B527398
MTVATDRARRRPVVLSVITPVGDAPPAQLADCLRSIASQRLRRRHGAVEHLVVVDSSLDDARHEIVASAARAGSITSVRTAHRATSAAGLDAAVERASGSHVAIVRDGDVVAPGALAILLDGIDDPGRVGGRECGPSADDPVDVVYADHAWLDGGAGRRHDAAPRVDPSLDRVRPELVARKPAWSPERLRTHDYVVAPVLLRRSLLAEIGGLRGDLDGALGHDLLLRAGEVARRIVHVPHVALHRRSPVPAPLASTRETAAAVGEHLERIGLARCRPEPPVSVVIPTNGSTGEVWGVERCFVVECVRSMLERSTHRELEFVVVVDASTPAPVIRVLRDLATERLTLVPFDRPFNFSEKIDAGVAAASADLLLLLNDDTELVDPDGVGRLVATVLGPAEGAQGRWGDVGIAGARLLHDDGTLQHGGVVLDGHADHVCRGWPGDTPGPAPTYPLAGAHEASAVTAAAALVRRDVYVEVGGMETALPLNFNDVDLCAKVRERGHRIVYRSDATWYHFESRTRVPVVLDRETAFVYERWGPTLRRDPYYHPALIPARFDWSEADHDVAPAPFEPAVLADAVARNLAALRARARRGLRCAPSGVRADR